MRKINTILRKSLIASAALSLTASLNVNAANRCTDYDAIESAPYFAPPAKTGFRYFWNGWLAKDTPFHMGHDQIVPEGESTTVVGKFDYGAVFHKDLESEYVNAYIHGTGLSQWYSLGRL